MINAWSLAYDVINGTLDEHFPIKKKTMTAETYPIKEDDMSPCKLDDINITTATDPIFTVGSGNTASASTNDYWVDTTQMGEVSIDTSALDNQHITIDSGDAVVNFDDIGFTIISEFSSR